MGFSIPKDNFLKILLPQVWSIRRPEVVRLFNVGISTIWILQHVTGLEIPTPANVAGLPIFPVSKELFDMQTTSTSRRTSYELEFPSNARCNWRFSLILRKLPTLVRIKPIVPGSSKAAILPIGPTETNCFLFCQRERRQIPFSVVSGRHLASQTMYTDERPDSNSSPVTSSMSISEFPSWRDRTVIFCGELNAG